MRFEYLTRALQLVGIPPTIQAQLTEERDQQLEDYLASLEPTPWTAVTFENSWVNTGGGTQPAEYRKIGDMVYGRLHIKSGTLSSSAFTLPEGFCPPRDFDVPAAAGVAQPAWLNIQSTGTCVVYASTSTSFSTTFQFSVTA